MRLKLETTDFDESFNAEVTQRGSTMLSHPHYATSDALLNVGLRDASDSNSSHEHVYLCIHIHLQTDRKQTDLGLKLLLLF